MLPLLIAFLNLPSTYLALGILDLGGQPLYHSVQLVDLLLRAAQGLPMPDHGGLHLLTLGVGETEMLMKPRM